MIEKLIQELDENHEFSDLVDILNEHIVKRKKDIVILEKNVITTLATKMEVFLEKSSLKWLEKQIELKNTASSLTDNLKKEVIKNTALIIYDEIKEGTISAKNKKKLYNFNLLLDENYPLENLDFDFRLPLNSHGTTEIEKLLKKIGIDNIFKDMEQIGNSFSSEEIVEGLNLTSKKEYKGNIDKLINYRNCIVHEDVLNSLSISDLNDFIQSVNLLGQVVLQYLGEVSNLKIDSDNKVIINV